MAWKFRIGLRREEHGGAAVQVAEPVPEHAAQETAEPVASSVAEATEVTEFAAEASVSVSPTEALAEEAVAIEIAGRTKADDSQQEAATPETAAAEPVDEDKPEENLEEIPAEEIAAAIDALTAPEPAEAKEAASEPPTAPEIEPSPLAPSFPAIASDWAFEEKLAIHKEWVESQGVSGQKIDLSGAKLEGAELVGVNLRYANLQEADFKAADLLLADLRDSSLARANLEETCLVGANLEGANMEGASLSTAMGLVPRQLAGANLRDAMLPAQILEFPALADLARASRTAVSFFSATMLSSALSWLMILKTRDVQLISDSSIFPFLHSTASSAFPTAEIYLILPALLVAVYLTFQYHLQRVWDSVLELPAIFPNGSSLDEERPWIIKGLLRTHFRWMNHDAPSTRFIEKAISMMLAYWLVPASLLGFWGRYLTAQDMHGSLLQVVLFAVATGVAVYSTTRVGRPEEARASDKKLSAGIFQKLKSLSLARLIGAIVVVLFVLSLGTVKGIPHDVARAPQFAAADIRRWAPSVFWAIGYDPYAELTEAALSTKPEGSNGADDQLASVKGARLNAAKFRYAQAYGVFLAAAHLFRTDFTGAFLSEADMRGADLGQSTLRLAILDRAQMARTNLDRANLDGANMTRADLRGANLSYSSLINATLVDAQLEGASLYSARLSNASLIRANLTKTDFREAHLEGANFEHAEMHQAYLWSAKLASSHFDNAQLGTAIFIDADLRNSDMHGAHFQGTVVNGANLQGANLDYADMHGVLGVSANQICSAASRNGLQLDDAIKLQVDAQCGGGAHTSAVTTPAVSATPGIVGPLAPASASETGTR